MQILEPVHSATKDQQNNPEVALEQIDGAISMVEAVNEIGDAHTMEGVIDADNAKAKDDSHKSEVAIADAAYKYALNAACNTKVLSDDAVPIAGAVHDAHYGTEVVINADNTVHSRAATNEESGISLKRMLGIPLTPQNVRNVCFIYLPTTQSTY